MTVVAAIHPNSASIVIDPSNNVGEPNKAHGKPGGPIIFVVYNLNSSKKVVRIPPNQFVPDPPEGEGRGPEDPLVHVGQHWAFVDPGDAAVIQLKARKASHFPSGNFTYKYTIYWADDIFGTNERHLDPQIEINN